MRSRVLGIRRGDTGDDSSYFLVGEDFSFLVFFYGFSSVDNEALLEGMFFLLIFAVLYVIYKLDLLLLLPSVRCS